MRLFSNIYIKLAVAITVISGTVGSYAYATGRTTMTVQAAAATTIANSASTTPDPAAGGAAQPTTPAKPATPSTPAVPTCQKSAYRGPAAPAVSASQPGLQSTILAPSYYTVYGNSVSQVLGQMAACSPSVSSSDRFASSTDYALNWAFDYVGDGSGLCHVTNASVGINISIVYPTWQSGPRAAAGLNASWQRFITNLTTHENGHVQIDQAGAAQLYKDLQNFPPTSCDNIVAQVTAKAATDTQAINQNNENYDLATNHGATQGALLN